MVRQSDSTLAVPAQQEWAGPQTGGRTVGSTADAESGTLVFTRSGDADPSRARIRTARVAEQAAQRQATLVRAQQSVALRAAQASDQARRTQLAETEKQTQANELRLIEEKRRQAEEARKAAEAAAQQASEPNGNGGATGTAASDQQNQQPTPTSPQIDAGAISTGRGVSPVAGAVVGAQFGQWGSWSRWHTGLDFRASYGTPIRAVQNGIVVFAGNSGDWAGNHVAIRHAGGVTSMSSHMSRMAVSSGQSVQAGQIIGYVGETGRAFGAHLHFELYPAGVRYGDVYRAINPLPWLASNGVQTR
nr:M23 family metallopeptidase [Microlunatus panaciterrae]